MTKQEKSIPQINRRGAKKDPGTIDTRYPPAPSNPMHRNRKNPLFKMRINEINQRMYLPQCRFAIWTM